MEKKNSQAVEDNNIKLHTTIIISSAKKKKNN